MLKKFFAVMAILVLAAPAQAGVLGNYLTFDGFRDTVKDQSVGMVIDSGLGNIGVLGVGDLVQGMYRIDTVAASGKPEANLGSTDPSIYGVYSFEVKAVGSSGTDSILKFGTVSAANVSNSLSSMLNASGLAGSVAGLTDNPASSLVATDATFAIVENLANVPVSAMQTGAGTMLNVGAIGGQISSGNGWNVGMLMGFDATDDFHEIRFQTVSVLDVITNPLSPSLVSFTGTELLDLTKLAQVNVLDDAAGTSTNYGDFKGVYSVISHNFGNGTIFLPQVETTLSNPIGLGYGDVSTTSPTSVGTATAAETANGWLFADTANFKINAVPEPASIIGFACLSAILATSRKRKSITA
ncbi:hypothetical protein CA13_25820 [Planctomycetes bacterium CA13]|uniref:PEP-CTERM protein-sorting domain-containing protein n=1 Tax=Novipirellula herctigrandis TaxID=2527986 RepID=A0A5C5Z1E6_9BACT|nr:hypothetical protein CA13_25820 [Planctomycetes bacterium CA13]